MRVTRRDWWLGVVLIVGAILVHATVPRYEWQGLRNRRGDEYLRIDRWTGQAVYVWVDMLPDMHRKSR